ncbi:response regulator transcription factor [Paenibacillus alkalitolerans]|uniref:response regulator transcription factor n=1 Tax=Paenibacillus alkalitolerans TaxID=2799335 RepID=UPI0018F31CD7|nr:helix-turn-helix domain-containing protein [Paenibacillus alkalitolerans]
MYKVMLVDDDYPVLELLSEAIPWNSLGLRLEGAYENGLAALEAAERSMPDIVITDIGMPKIDGLELVRRLKERKPDLRAAILSCHSEFQYAQQAMKLQVQDYIVKDTLDPDDLQQVLIRFSDSLEQERRLNVERHRLRQMADRSREAMKEKWIQSAVQMPLLQAGGWKEELEAFGLPTDGRTVLPVVGFIDDYRSAKRRFLSDDTLRFAVSNVIEEVVRESSAEAVLFPYSGKEWVVLHSFRPTLTVNGYDVVRQLLERIQSALRRTLKLSMSFVIGEMSGAPEQLKQGLVRLLAGTGQRFYMERGEIAAFRHAAGASGDLFAFYDQASECFRECIMKRDASQAKAKAEEWTRFLRMSGYASETVKDWSLKLLLDIRLKHYSLYSFRASYSAESLNKEVSEIGSLYELRDWLTEHLLSAVSAEETRVRTQRKEVLDACQYVSANLDQRIGLEEVAEYLHLNASYFSRLFKKERGETFIEYVIRTKMERAKELLDQTAHPVAKICEMLGYDNQSYFIKLFKGCTGVTPNDYRNRGA